MSVKERLKQIRQSLKLTQCKFAERIAISNSYLAGMERGDKKITERTIKQIAMEFGASAHWLRTGEGEMYSESEEIAVAKANSLFKSLTPSFQEHAIRVLDGLVSLQKIATGDEEEED